MDERLHKNNRLPGCEKLTRPEEIKQLSKYLKKIKESYEESTRLEDQVLGVTGYSTGKIPKIEELGKKSVKVPEGYKEVGLRKKVLGLDSSTLYDDEEGDGGGSGSSGSSGSHSVIRPEGNDETEDLRLKEKTGLSNKRIDLTDSRDNSLVGESVKRPDNFNEEVKNLDDTIIKIQEIQKQRDELEGKRINLTDSRNITLPDKRLDLQAMINASLENKRVKLGGEIKETSLTDKKVEIKDERNLDLANKKIDLTDSRDVELGNKKIEITDSRNIDLEDKRLDIQDAGIDGLESKRIDIKDDNSVELEDKKIRLKDERDLELANKKIKLVDENEVELGNKKLKINDERDSKLEDKRLDIQDKRELEIGQKRLDIEDKRETNLSQKRIDIQDNRENELGDKKISLASNVNGDQELELGQKKLGLEDDREYGLGNKRIDLTDEREIELTDKRLDLKDDRENSLSDKRLDLEDGRENKLSDKRLDLTDERNLGLTDKRLDIKDDRTNSLSDKILSLFDNRENELSEKRLDLKDDRENKLEDKRLDLEDGRENKLGDKRINLEDDRENKLSEKRLNLEDNRDPSLSDKILGIIENENGEPEELYDSFLGLPENENGEPSELYDQYIGIIENENSEVENLGDKIVELAENQGEEVESLGDELIKIAKNQGTAPDLSNIDSLKQYTAGLSDAELYELAMKIASEGDDGSGEIGGWLSKVEGLMSTYLSSDILLPKRAIEFRDAINNSLEMSYFGNLAGIEYRQNNREGNGSKDSSYTYINPETDKPLNIGEKSKPIPFPDSQSETVKDGDVKNLKPGFLRVPVDTSSGTIWAKAEEAIGPGITGTNRRDALDEMIVMLVDYKKSNLPRLPGSDLEEMGKSVVKNITGVVTGDSHQLNPVNKPLSLNGLAIPGGPGDAFYQAVNNRTKYDNLSLDKVGDLVGDTFYNRYWSSKSFKTTLEELCPTVGKAPVVSLTELKALLKASPYFTSPGKFMTDSKGSYNTMSLDTNMYWEVVIEPFCAESGPCSNGGFSYLPSIQEINYENKEVHKVSTNYGFWAPINGFELQKSKLQTKSLQLYEGEIAYPTGMEFTNELRLTFVDDSWKSWRRYFEKCAQVAVFNSYPHRSSFYSSPITSAEVTVVDKSNVCIAPYKNIAFNIRIYILNPQLNMLKKYDLLCILKDYAEEYVGEIDSGGTDLNVSFSIVGENPGENKSVKFETTTYIVKELARQAALETQKRITGALNSSIGLI